jgi:peptidoglycan hydrolase CwlO-like protein
MEEMQKSKVPSTMLRTSKSPRQRAGRQKSKVPSEPEAKFKMQSSKLEFQIKEFLKSALVIVVGVFLLILLSSSSAWILAEGDCNLHCLGEKIAKLEEQLRLSREATTPLEAEVKRLDREIASIERQLRAAAARIDELEQSIVEREEDLSFQYGLLSVRIRSYYKRTKHFSPLLVFLSSANAADVARSISYQAAATSEDKRVIVSVTSDLISLEEDQASVEEDRRQLAGLQAQLDSQAEFFRGEIAGAKEYQAELSSEIAELSAKQQAILQGRSGTFTSSVGEVPISSIPCSGPPGSPEFCSPGGGYFGGFSFGAWTHRKGMSQYGARGRAEAGQSTSDILSAYYGKTPAGKDTGGDIAVDGYGSMNFEDKYLMGIAEMPSSWHSEALKAQAIAARTYAYRYKNEGRSICTTESCQVFSKSKSDNPPGEWRQAVEDTRGQVLEDVITYYSSTAGGYLTYPRGIWDTTDGQGGEGFASRAWESKAGSPWFYSSWYTQTYRSGSATCGRSHPWLSQEEMADILNAWLVLSQGGDDRVMPITINECPIGGVGGNPYSMAELRDRANSLGGAFTSVSGVSVVYSNAGETASVSFSTNKVPVTITGSEFKKAFNLRAPGYIAIYSPLFSIEKT